MPNGFHGTDEAWARLEAPLLRLDPVVEEFARAHGLSVGRNYHYTTGGHDDRSCPRCHGECHIDGPEDADTEEKKSDRH